MSKIINQLAGQSDDRQRKPRKPQQLDLLDAIPLSVKTPPSVTAPIPPRTVAAPSKIQAPPTPAPELSTPESVNTLVSSEPDMKTTQDYETLCEELRMEIAAISESLEAERRKRHSLEMELETLTASSSANTADASAGKNANSQEEDLRAQFRHYEQSSASQMAQLQTRLAEGVESLQQEQFARAQDISRIQTLESELAELRSALEEARQSRESTLVEALALREELDHLRALHQQNLEDLSSLQNDLSSREQHAKEQLIQCDSTIKTLTQDRDQALESARLAEAQRQKALARFVEHEKLWHIRLHNANKPAAATGQRLPVHALKTLPIPITALTILIIVACGASFLLGRWQGQGHLFASQHKPTIVAAQILKGPVSVPDAPRSPELLEPASIPVAPRSLSVGETASKAAPITLPQISMDGVQVHMVGKNGMTLLFDYGLFSRRSELSDRAKRDLTVLAKQFAGHLGPLTMEIEGHTDASPVSTGGPFDTNHKLGLKRAEVVRDFLVGTCRLPAATLIVTSAGDARPLFPNTSPESQRKNRTVVLKLAPASF